MAQFQHMDARLNTFTTKLHQLNTRVDCIAQRQARLGGFVDSTSPSLSPSPEASEDENDEGDFDGNDADEDDGASSSSEEEMPASQ